MKRILFFVLFFAAKTALGQTHVSTIAAMESYSGSETVVIVTDTVSGGIFNYYGTGAVNYGTIFPATGKGSGFWIRQYSGDVHTSWFGAYGDRKTDDANAIQAAVNYCIGKSKNLFVDGMSYVSKPIQVDREIDGAGFDNYFIISSTSGGGFLVKSAIPVISTQVPYSTKPVSQLVYFKNITFESLNSADDAYVLDGARFLRIFFDGCNFDKIKLLNSAAVYLQTYHFVNCNMRRWTGTWIKNGLVSYDVKFSNCIAEAGDSFFEMTYSVQTSISQCLLEGLTGTAIKYINAHGLEISGTHFESNGQDINGNGLSHSIGLYNNFFTHFPVTQASVSWGQVRSCISVGNWSNGTLHQFNVRDPQITLNDHAELSVQNISNNLFNQGEIRSQGDSNRVVLTDGNTNLFTMKDSSGIFVMAKQKYSDSASHTISKKVFQIDKNGVMSFPDSVIAPKFVGKVATAELAEQAIRWHNYTLETNAVFNDGFDFILGRTNARPEVRLITPTGLSSFIGLNNYAPLISPNFSGTPQVPTAPIGTNSTQIANTAFVLANSSAIQYQTNSDATPLTKDYLNRTYGTAKHGWVVYQPSVGSMYLKMDDSPTGDWNKMQYAPVN